MFAEWLTNGITRSISPRKGWLGNRRVTSIIKSSSRSGKEMSRDHTGCGCHSWGLPLRQHLHKDAQCRPLLASAWEVEIYTGSCILIHQVTSVLSDSWAPSTVARQALCPWDSPVKSTGVGCHAFMQWIFLTRYRTHVSCGFALQADSGQLRYAKGRVSSLGGSTDPDGNSPLGHSSQSGQRVTSSP